MLEGECDRRAQLGVVVGLRDADRRAEPRRLDEAPGSRTALRGSSPARSVTLRVTGMPLSRSTDLKRSLSMQSAEAVTPGPTYGDVGQLEQALHRPVLAERAVQHREDDVDVAERRGHRAVGQPRELAAGRRPSSSRARRRAERPAPARSISIAHDVQPAAPRAPRRRCAPRRPTPRARSSGRPRAPRRGGGSRRRRRASARRRWSCRSVVSSCVVVGRVPVGSVSIGVLTSLPDEERHRRALLERPARRVLREHEAVLARVGDVLRHDGRLEAGVVEQLLRRRRACRRSRSGPRPSPGPSRP